MKKNLKKLCSIILDAFPTGALETPLPWHAGKEGLIARPSFPVSSAFDIVMLCGCHCLLTPVPNRPPSSVTMPVTLTLQLAHTPSRRREVVCSGPPPCVYPPLLRVCLPCRRSPREQNGVRWRAVHRRSAHSSLASILHRLIAEIRFTQAQPSDRLPAHTTPPLRRSSVASPPLVSTACARPRR